MKSGVLVTSGQAACVKSSVELIQRLDLAVGHRVHCGALNRDDANAAWVRLLTQTRSVPTKHHPPSDPASCWSG